VSVGTAEEKVVRARLNRKNAVRQASTKKKIKRNKKWGGDPDWGIEKGGC